MTDANSVSITLREVYDEQRAMSKVVNQMASDLKRTLDAHDRVADQVGDHEQRIRDLERLVWKASGIATILGIAGSTVVQAMFK